MTPKIWSKLTLHKDFASLKFNKLRIIQNNADIFINLLKLNTTGGPFQNVKL